MISPLGVLFAAMALGQAPDTTAHSIQFVTVEAGVKLEVLDWGGSGRPLVMLAGLGNDAHVFDKFAPKLTDRYHVYGITRRGFGASSAPSPTGDGTYSADRLGDDVLAVMEALKLDRPVLAGHSIAGQELSSVGSRHPEKVAGLIYLDAGYGYAFYDRSRGDLNIDLTELQRKLEQIKPGRTLSDPRPLFSELLDRLLPAFERDLKEEQSFLETLPPAMLASESHMPAVSQAILTEGRKYTSIKAPILAIFAVPHDMGPEINKDPVLRARFETHDLASTGAQAKDFEAGLPSARVVRLAHANHYVFRSNEADVLREMKAFIDGLKN